MLIRIIIIFIMCHGYTYSQDTQKVTEIIYEVERDDFGLERTYWMYQLLLDESSYKYSEIQSTTSENSSPKKYPITSPFYSYHLGEVCSNINYELTNYPGKKDIVIKDQLPDLKWEIDKTEFKWQGYICKKATTTYRGRVIYAYFTEDVPISVGPHNLNGLPGAILYAITHDQVFEIKAKSVKTISRPDSFIDYNGEYNFGDVISKKDYVSSKDEHAAQLGELARLRIEGQAQEQTGSKTKFELMALGRHTLELYYEWELDLIKK